MSGRKGRRERDEQVRPDHQLTTPSCALDA